MAVDYLCSTAIIFEQTLPYMTHQFDTDHAERYGIHCAILLQNFIFWIGKNKANKRHFYDGRHWTYNSVKAFEELFPYMTKKVIRTSIEKLVADGILVTGNYSQDSRDRTLWYAFSDECIFLSDKMHLPSRENVIASQGNSSINTDNKHTDTKLTDTPSPVFEFEGIEFPFKTDAFKQAFDDWQEWRKKKRAKLTRKAVELQFKDLAKLTEEHAIHEINRSIKNGWTGIFPQTYNSNGNTIRQNQTNTGGISAVLRPGDVDYSEPL